MKRILNYMVAKGFNIDFKYEKIIRFKKTINDYEIIVTVTKINSGYMVTGFAGFKNFIKTFNNNFIQVNDVIKYIDTL